MPVNAKLQIQTVLRNGITCLEQSYFTAPLKVANITEDKSSKQLHLMLMSSSPGILDEDEHGIKIKLREGSDLELQTQSYQRLFNMKTGAKQSMEVCLEKGSSFVYLPHPVVPHENSIFIVKNRIYLSDDCRLMWGEVLTCGRKLSKGLLSENGEIFQLSRYHNITEVFINDKLVIKENLLMEPLMINANSMGQLEGFTHQASFIYLDERADCREISNAVHEYLSLQKEMISGITSAPVNGLLIRLLGYKAEQLHDCLKAIHKIIYATIDKINTARAYAN
jgi:urease accessory protein